MKPRRKATRVGEGLAWCAGAGVLVLGACVPLAGAGFVFDVGANLAAQGLVAGLAVGAWMAATRRWARAAATGAACAVMAWPLVARPWTVSAGAPAPAVPVRVLVFNSSTSDGNAPAAMGLIASTDADVVVLTEPSGELLDLIRASPEIGARYPGFFLPERAGGGYLLVLSAWAQSPVVGPAPKDVAGGGFRVMRLERPEGPFVLVALHPDSPRSAAEWARGNQAVERAVGVLRTDLLPKGLPVIVAADMNSAPGGWRSRRLSTAGLRRGKPLLAFGTYPAAWPGPLRVAIDDVWVSAGVEVTGWTTLGDGGSDHRAVAAEVLVPRPAGAAP